MRKLWIPIFVLLMLSAICLARKKDNTEDAPDTIELSEELEGSFSNAGYVVRQIHDGLARHAESVTVVYRPLGGEASDAERIAEELMDAAMYNTDSPIEGDYVRYQYGGYKMTCQKLETGDGEEIRLKIVPVYYSTLAQEQEVDAAVGEILEGLELGEQALPQEKVAAVYDYICQTVRYDYAHKNSSKYYKDSTAYAALVKNYASCQGYAVAVFRLCMELGVECRVVTGTGINSLGEEEFHAWNEVVLDGETYELDATWDAGKESYDYFMLREEDFPNHTKSNTGAEQ